jgi:hypothetical protein
MLIMRDPSPCRWNRWRVALPTPAAIANRMAGLGTAATAAALPEEPGPDGIRHGLVARVRAEIAAGVYDTEEKWLAAEEALFARVTGG